MRRVFATLIIAFGISTAFTFATTSGVETSAPEKTYKTFTQVGIDEIPSKISDILFFEYKDFIVKSVEVKTNKSTDLYRVTLIDSENYEYTIYIDETGKIFE